LTAAASVAGIELSSDAAATLVEFESLLIDRAIPMGLVSEADRDRLLERHILDCLRPAAVLRPEDRLAFDLGSGAGLPGIVLAITIPRCRLRLIEPKAKAAGFLDLVVDRLALRNVDVVTQRAEEVTGPADVVTARAFAPVNVAWEAAHRLLRPGGRLVYFAGEGFDEEDARGLTSPEPPAEVRLEAVIEKSSPLVIMVRRE
jgi:16S rRNA (guanine527-N7)-methyltransferase